MAGSDAPLPRLLLVGGDGHPSGVPRHIWHLSSVLASRARITVASDISHGGYDGLEDVGIRHLTVPGLKSSLSPRRALRGWRGLRRLLRTERPDLVWLHARLPVVFGRVMLALRLWRPGPQTRVAVTYHGLPFGPGHRPGLSALSRLVERALLAACPPLDLIFLSQTMAQRMEAAMGASRMARHRVHVLPNGSDLGPLPPPATPRAPGRHLVMTGRCGWQKNYPLAVRLFAELPDDYTLTLCGAGTDSPDFRSRLARDVPQEVLARIRFAGSLRDVRPVLAQADGYLLTSRYEGLPIGALEAYEAGLPLILGRFDGAAELAADHPMALVLDLQDLHADARRITDLLERYAASRETATAGIQAVWARTWSHEAFATRANALFNRLTGPAPT